VNIVAFHPDRNGNAFAFPASSRARSVQEHSLFAGALARATREGTAADQAHQAAAHLVATALIAPVLKGLRESGMAAPPFAPGPGERVFGSIQDDVLARRLTAARNWPLIERIAERLLAKGGAA
jgi:hypothetical protein